MLAEAQRIARLGNWEWDLLAGSIRWSKELSRIFGVAPGVFTITYESFLTAVHDEDRAKVKQAVDEALHHRHPFHLGFRIVHPDGSERLVFAQGEVSRDKTGRPLRMVGTLQDVTDRKRGEEALRESEERTRLIIESALDAVVVMDVHGRIIEWNSQAAAIFGWSHEEILGQRLSSTIIPPQYRQAHERGVQHFLATGDGPVLNTRIEITAVRRSGQEFPIELTISPMRRGNALTFSAFIRDITDRKRAEIRQATQFAVSRAIAESATLDDAATPLLESFCTMMGWQLAAIWLVDRYSHTLGRLASEIAHDFNNLLTVINGYSEMALLRR